MPSLISVISVNLSSLRAKKGLTQHALAAVTGVSRATIARYESGQGGYESSTLIKLAAALGVQDYDLARAFPAGRKAEAVVDRFRKLIEKSEEPDLSWLGPELLSKLAEVKDARDRGAIQAAIQAGLRAIGLLEEIKDPFDDLPKQTPGPKKKAR